MVLSDKIHLTSTAYTFLTLRNPQWFFSPTGAKKSSLSKPQVSTTDPLLKLLTGGKGENLPTSQWDK